MESCGVDILVRVDVALVRLRVQRKHKETFKRGNRAGRHLILYRLQPARTQIMTFSVERRRRGGIACPDWLANSLVSI